MTLGYSTDIAQRMQRKAIKPIIAMKEETMMNLSFNLIALPKVINISSKVAPSIVSPIDTSWFNFRFLTSNHRLDSPHAGA